VIDWTGTACGRAKGNVLSQQNPFAIENKQTQKQKMDQEEDDQHHGSGIASSSFQTPSRGKARSLQQQQQHQQPRPNADEPPTPPLPPSSWRKRIADRWGNNGGAPSSSFFFVRQRSSTIGPDDDTGGGGITTTMSSRTMTMATKRSDHLSRLILRQALSRRLLSSYTTTEMEDDDDRVNVKRCDDGDDEEGIEIVAAATAPTPRMSNHTVTTGHHVGTSGTTALLHSSCTLRSVEDDIILSDDDDNIDDDVGNSIDHDHYTADDVEMMRRSVYSEEAVSHRLQYVHTLVQSSFYMVAPLEVKLTHVTIAAVIPNDIDNGSNADGPSSSSSWWHHHGHRRSNNRIKTVYNTSCLYPIIKRLKHSFTGELRHDNAHGPSLSSSRRRHLGPSPSSTAVVTTNTKYLLQDINLCLTPGTQYLVLGAPGSGKTSLLKAIAGLLLPTTTATTTTEEEAATRRLHNDDDNNNINNNTITYNDRMLSDGDYYIRNAVSYIASTDWHATRLTVYETLAFAYQCLHGPRAIGSLSAAVPLALATLGLEDASDKYVGGDLAVRGISGGQRRRVSTGELLMGQAPVLCGDEITTGLDASAAYDMLQVILHYSRLQKQTKVLALLQPSPEMVSLFDEIIVLCESQIIYAGKLDHVERYFGGIGYRCPEFMDIADFLTMVGNCPDHFYHHRTTTTTMTTTTTTASSATTPPPDDGGTGTAATAPPQPPTASQLAELFRQSPLGTAILDNLAGPSQYVFTQREVLNNSRHDGSIISKLADSRFVNRRYANSFGRSTLLIARRFLTLYVRDRRVLIAGAVKNVLMGVSVGGVFFDTTDPLSIHGALFQAGLFIMLGSMQNSTALLHDRLIFYKHRDASFYSAWPFAFGRTLSQIPQVLCDTVTFATILYYMIGLADRASVANFSLFLGILLCFALLMNAQMNLFASLVDKSKFQVYAAVTLLLMMLFGGFIIPPNVIPIYYVWLYWCNPFTWAYRALIINEFRSDRWEDPDQMLRNYGFSSPHAAASGAAAAFGPEWIGYGVMYMTVYILFCIVGSALALTYIRHDRDASATDPAEKLDRLPPTLRTDGSSACSSEDSLDMPFTPVTLSFKNLSYVVASSTSTATKEPLKLLQNVNGILRPGRMCALMVRRTISSICMLSLALALSFSLSHPSIRLGFERCRENDSNGMLGLSVWMCPCLVLLTVCFLKSLLLHTNLRPAGCTYRT
jgi:ABC-type multidrug transport system ATPase subunit